jgi:phytoene desaturase
MKTIIIGSGLAGLTAGLRLARAGQAVTILEQGPVAGGVTQGYEQDGFRWDYGQLNLEAAGAHEPAGAVLAELGVLERIEVIPEQREYIFPDFEIRPPIEYGGIKWRIEELKRLFPAEAEGLERYWRDYVRFTRLMTRARRMEDGRLPSKVAFFGALLPLLPMKDWTAARLLAHYFRDMKLKAVFVSILADFFTPPSQFQGLGVFMLNAEKAYERRMPSQLARDAEMIGLYTIRGGTRALVEAYLAALAESGAELRLNATVERIRVEVGRVTGVSLADGTSLAAERVIASGGAKETFLKLLEPGDLSEEFKQKLAGLPLMDSVFMLHLGVDSSFPALHCSSTYFYGSYDIEGQVKLAREGVYHEGAAGFVVHWPSLRSPEMAPAGMQALTIYTICPEKLKEGDWERDKEVYAEKLLGYAEKYLPGLRQSIRTQVIVSPLELRKITHLEHHAFGGLAPVMNAWRPPHQTPVQGLWFIGAQSESGGGMNSVIPSADQVAKRVMAGN